MAFTAEQHNFYDEPSRLFFMEASRLGVPFEALHLYVGPSATIRVKVASLVRLVDAHGPQMYRAETVTLFNDMCLLAPSALIDPAIGWEELDARTVRATFANGGISIRAELSFNDAGELVNFVSDGRWMASPDGRTFTNIRWSTPVGDYRFSGPHRMATRGEARWHVREGEYAYGQFELLDIVHNPER